jgi:hypothetical protein
MQIDWADDKRIFFARRDCSDPNLNGVWKTDEAGNAPKFYGPNYDDPNYKPQALTHIVSSTNYIVWSDVGSAGRIQACTVNGNIPTCYVWTGQSNPVAITAGTWGADAMIFWTNYNTNKVMKLDLGSVTSLNFSNQPTTLVDLNPFAITSPQAIDYAMINDAPTVVFSASNRVWSYWNTPPGVADSSGVIPDSPTALSPPGTLPIPALHQDTAISKNSVVYWVTAGTGNALMSTLP